MKNKFSLFIIVIFKHLYTITMKKLILLLIFSTTLVVQTEIGNFKVIDGEII